MRFHENPNFNYNNLDGMDIIPMTDVTNNQDKRTTFTDIATWVLTKFKTSFLDSNQTIQTAISNCLGIYINSGSVFDMNNYSTKGIYYFNNSGTDAGGLLNTPNNAVNGWLIILPSNGTSIKQIWTRHGSTGGNPKTFTETFYRIRAGASTWSDWERIVTSSLLENTLTSTLASYVPTSRTVNGHALSANVTITASELGLAYNVKREQNPSTGYLTIAQDNQDLTNTGNLTAGTYLFIGNVFYHTNSTTGRRILWLSTSSKGTPHNNARVGANGGIQTQLSISHIATVSAGTTIFLCEYQNSGGDMEVIATLEWIKLHN